jgi:hypothetical protein
VVRIGIHVGKKQEWSGALSCSSAVARSQISLRAELRATTAPTMPNVVESTLDYAFWCFPHASPALVPRAGKQKRPRRVALNRLQSLRDFGAGEGIRTLDPNLGKVGIFSSARRRKDWHSLRKGACVGRRRGGRRAPPFRPIGLVRSGARPGERPGLSGAPGMRGKDHGDQAYRHAARDVERGGAA